MMAFRFKNIGIETTSICNSDCVVCPRGAYYEMPVTTMPMDLFEKIVIDLHDNRIEKTLRFSGMGDPSCDRLLIERLRFCRRRTPDLRLVVLSNMAAWKASFSDAIVEERLLDTLRASMFAASEKASEIAYGDRSQAATARAALEHFIAKNRSAGQPVRTHVYTLIHPGAEGEAERVKEAYWDLVDEFEIWRAHNWSNRFDFRPLQARRRECYRVEDFEASIRVNGDVVACSMDINHTLVYGNLRFQTMLEVYEGPAYRRLREMNRSGLIETNDTCRGCAFLNDDESDVLVESKPQLQAAE